MNEIRSYLKRVERKKQKRTRGRSKGLSIEGLDFSMNTRYVLSSEAQPVVVEARANSPSELYQDGAVFELHGTLHRHEARLFHQLYDAPTSSRSDSSHYTRHVLTMNRPIDLESVECELRSEGECTRN